MREMLSISFKNFLVFCTTPQSISLAIFLVVFSLFSLFISVVIKRISKQDICWQRRLFNSVRLPVFFQSVGILSLLLIGGFLSLFSKEFPGQFFHYYLLIMELFLVVWVLMNLISQIESHLVYRSIHSMKRDGNELLKEKNLIGVFGKLVRLFLIVLAAVIFLNIFRINLNGLLAFGGAATVVIGLAAKDILANFFGGLIIHFERPFLVDEWISSPDRDIEGVVEEIGWRLTRVRTFDKRIIYVPNALFGNLVIRNPSRMSHRRIQMNIPIDYRSWEKTTIVVSEIKEFLLSDPEIDDDQLIIVNCSSIESSSLNIYVYCFTKSIGFAKFCLVRERILLSIMNLLKSHTIKLARPVYDVKISDGSLSNGG